jgi:acyl carrier protein
MSMFTLAELKVVVHEASGVTDGVSLDESTLDETMRELGYDSLAVLEIASKLQRDFGIDMPDEAIEGMQTPRAILDYVNSQLTVKAA